MSVLPPKATLNAFIRISVAAVLGCRHFTFIFENDFVTAVTGAEFDISSLARRRAEHQWQVRSNYPFVSMAN
jgi:hypothetical protein